MADTMSGHHDQHVQQVLYVPPRHATAMDLRLSSSSSSARPCQSLRLAELPPTTHPPRSATFNSTASTSLSSAGPRSAFTAVHPRFHRYWSGLHHSLASQQQFQQQQQQPQQQHLSSIQQSYSKLFARNELLKLLVSKQLKSLYSGHPSHLAETQLSAPQPTVSVPLSPHKYAAMEAMDECQPSSTVVSGNRLLELSSVIKAINTARRNSTALDEQNVVGCPIPNGAHSDEMRVPSSSGFRRSDSTTSSTHSADGGPQSDVGAAGMIFRCDWNGCYRTFDTAEQWTIHVTHTHVIADSEDSLYYCQWKDCPRRNNGFNARYKMLIHVRSHTNDKPYRCPHCAKAFLRSETLRIHKRIHSSEKLFACKYLGCNKRYTDPSSLRKHVKTKNHIVIEV